MLSLTLTDPEGEIVGFGAFDVPVNFEQICRDQKLNETITPRTSLHLVVLGRDIQSSEIVASICFSDNLEVGDR